MKPFEEYTVKEILAMGYKITFEAPISERNSTGVHMHIPDKIFSASDEDIDKIKKWIKEKD